MEESSPTDGQEALDTSCAPTTCIDDTGGGSTTNSPKTEPVTVATAERTEKEAATPSDAATTQKLSSCDPAVAAADDSGDMDVDHQPSTATVDTQPSVDKDDIREVVHDVEPVQVDGIPSASSEKLNLSGRSSPEPLHDVFVNYKRKSSQKGSHKRRRIQIRLSQTTSSTSTSSNATGDKTEAPSAIDEPLAPALQPEFATALEKNREGNYDMQTWSSRFEEELEEALTFFEETHEEQLPAYQAFLQKRKDEDLKSALTRLDQKDRQGRAEIERILTEQMKEKRISTERSVEKYKARVVEDEKHDGQRLNMLYRQRTGSNQKKITQSVEILQRRHQKEIHAAMQRHQQEAQQRRVPEPIASAEWQGALRQIQAKQQRHMQELRAKGEEIKKKTDSDYKREQEKIRKVYEQKLKDAENSRQKLAAKLYNHFQQLRQRYLKRHLQKIARKREELLKPTEEDEKPGADLSSKTYTPRELAKTTMEEKAELNPPSPIKSTQSWAAESVYPMAGASARHKHRKGVMSQTRRQLSVEIHNEGIWVIVLKASDEDDKRSSSEQSKAESLPEEQEFVPWGARAHTLLESIVCGEVPSAFHSTDFGDTSTMQGGQVRCVVSDLRTSEEAASTHRAFCVREQVESSMRQLESKVLELTTVAKEAAKAVSDIDSDEKKCHMALETTGKEVAKARRCQDEFRIKFRNYLGPDGTPSQATNPKDREELTRAMKQYQTILDTALRREQAVKQKVEGHERKSNQAPSSC